MALRKLHRSCRTPSGWRLATVQEATDNLESIKRDNLLEEWERARLLDGWIGGAGYGFQPHEGFRSCLGYMFVVELPTPEISDKDDRDAALYSRVSLSKEGRSAALFLCCEDWNYEVLHWLIQGQNEEGRTSGLAASGDDKRKAASELVSEVARKLQSMRAKSRVPKTEFSCASMRALTSEILKSVKSVGYNIRRDILTEALFYTELLEIDDRCWKEMGLTKDLERFQELGFDTGVPSTWEAVADTVWYVAADAMAVAIVTECCKLQNRLVMHSDPLGERKRMDDGAFVASLIAYAHELLQGTFYGADSLWKFVEAAATEAKGNCEQFNAILRDRGLGTFSYKGKYDVVNTFLVQAAKKGDVNLVERLLESGVQPSETDDERGKIALHHAAKHDDESKGLEIAEMLLKNKSLANAVDMKKRTPLHRAAFCGHARMCRLLVHHNASVTCGDEDRQTPLHYALRHEQQNEEVIHVLISAKREDSVIGSPRLVDAKDIGGEALLVGAKDIGGKMPLVDAKDFGGEAPLMDAKDIGGKAPLVVAKDIIGEVSLMDAEDINGKMPLDAKDIGGEGPLMDVKDIGGKMPVDAKDFGGEMPLMDAKDISGEAPRVVDKDIGGKMPLMDAKDFGGEAPLMDAKDISGKAPLVVVKDISGEVSLMDGKDINGKMPLDAKDIGGEGPLMDAKDIGGKMPVDAKDFGGEMPLMDAKDIGGEAPLVVDKDIGGKIPLDAKDIGGEEPLMDAKEIGGEMPSDAKDIGGEAPLVDAKDIGGKTPLDFAVECQATNVRMVAWLLSLSSQPQSYFKKLHLPSYLRESSRMGYRDLVLKLLNEGADPLDQDDEGKTSFHYAAEGESDSAAFSIFLRLLSTEKQQVKKEKLLKTRDKYGRNVLHVAAFLGHKWLCHWLLSFPNMDTKDRDGQSAIYYAVAGAHENSEIFDKLIFRAQGTNQVFLKDDSQTTPLHVAAARGNLRTVEKLLSKRAISRQERSSYVGAPDVLGQTALHKAASGGYKRIVKKLLDEGANPLEERDSDGKTALHYAAQAENDGDATAIVKLLLNKYESNEHKFLLLFACAVGIGYAEQSPSSNSVLKNYLAEEKSKILNTLREENSLRVAAKLGNLDMTRELLIRAGENIALIRDPKWRAELSEQENKEVKYVLEKIDNIVVKPRTDKPALWDDLGLSAFANGLAALFLNPFVKSPITVGISGEWGMGKSSLMVQTERVLIQTAAQLAFSNSIPKEDDPGASKSNLSAKGEVRSRKITNALERSLTAKSRETESKPVEERSDAKEIEPNFIQKIGMFITRALGNAKNSAAKVTDPLYDFLGNYQPEYHEIFKSLAVMERRDMFLEEDESGSRNRRLVGVPWGKDSMQQTIPSILTVRYNAWEYRNESEAWAGLAVEITKELEATMTMAQKLRTSWRYNWRTRRNNIYFGVILPCFLAVFMAIWFTTIVWLLLDRAQNNDIKDLKYGSLPVSVIVFFWAVVKSVLSAVKPISAQIVDYLGLPDHSQKLGYQQKVIFDIKFLKDELGNRPSRMWRVFAFMWCCIQLSWDENYVPETKIPKMPPACKDNLRIVVFVDDLDRCQENVILKVLSAVNLVLATCEINVILGMDKSMIERAIIRKFGDKNSEPYKSNKDLADKYLRKIIQLPLDLPDPSSSESQHFLQCQLGMLDSRKGTYDLEAEREKPNSNGSIKVNRKYQMGTSIPRTTKPARGETIKSLAEPEAEQERACSILDTTQGGSQNTEHFETNGKPGPVVETKIVIAHIQQPIKQDEHRAGGDEQMAGAQKHQEDRKSEPRLKDLLRITIDMLFPEYSEGERNAFCLLHTQFTSTRNPREWKCLLTYHRLAWNILCKSPQVKRFAGWQVQLVAWVFVCWQWKHLITTLVQNWHDLGVVHPIQKGVVIEEISGPSLREIVEHYIDERWPADKKSDIIQEDNGTKGGEVIGKVLKRGYSLKIKGLQWSNKRNRKQKEQDDLEGGQKLAKRKVLQEQKEEDNKGESFLQQGTTVKENDKASHKARNNGKSNAKDEEEEREEWRKLRETLSRYNVSMDGIQAFQKFRFYCDPGHLPWPLPKQA